MAVDLPAVWWTPARTAVAVAGAIAYTVVDFYHRTGAAVRVPTVLVQAHSFGDWLGIGIQGLLIVLAWGITLWGGVALSEETTTDRGLCAIATLFAVGFSVMLTLVFWPPFGLEVLL